MQYLLKQTIFWLCRTPGIGLLYPGVRFSLDPPGAESDYVIHTITNGDFSFQYTKGVREFFFGVVILALIWKKEWRTLGFVLLPGAIILAVDFCIVISHTDFTAGHLYAHLTTVFVLFGFQYSQTEI
jgi:hypothetical protein